ncbi:MAG: hypothetical protein ACI9MC_001614 [Kiritimatiellia bacterium]
MTHAHRLESPSPSYARTLVLAGNPPVVCNDDAVDWYGLATTYRLRARNPGAVRLHGLELVRRVDAPDITLFAGSVQVGEHVDWVPSGARLLVQDGQTVRRGQQLASWDRDERPVLAIDRGLVRMEGTVQRPKSHGGALVVGREGMRVRLVRRGVELQSEQLSMGAVLKMRPGQACLRGALLAIEPGNFAMLGPPVVAPDPVELALQFQQFPDLDRGERLGYLLKALGDAPERLVQELSPALVEQLQQVAQRTEAFAYLDDNSAKYLGPTAYRARQRSEFRFRRGFSVGRKLWDS